MVGIAVSDEQQVERAHESAHERVFVAPEHLRSAVEDAARDEGWMAAADVLQRHWDLYATRDPHAMLEALKGLPGEVFVERPSMLIVADYLQQAATGQDVGRFHDGARDMFGGTREPRELLDSLIALTGRAAGARLEGALDTARLRSVEARRMLERADESARGRAREALPHLMIQWGRCRELADADGAIAEYEQSHHLGSITGQPEIARRAAGSLAWLLAERGRLSDARTWLAHAHATERDSPRYDAVLHLTEALIAADGLENAAATQALARVDESAIGEYWAAYLWVRAMVARGPLAPLLVRHEMAGETERRVRALFDQGANRRYLVRAASALDMELNEPLTPTTPNPEEPRAADVVRQALDLYRAGAHAAARAHARTALAASPPVRDEAAAQLLLAACELALGGADAAGAAFCRAHALIAHERLLRTYRAITASDLKALADMSGLAVPASLTEPHYTTTTTGPAPESHANLDALTRRERELLVLIADGQPFADIADTLFISLNTVKTLTRSLYRKLDVHSRAEAAALARQL